MAIERPTDEEREKLIMLVRILIGDVEQSIFYPVLTDEDLEALLVMEGWNPRRAARRAAISISFYLATTNISERTGDIQVVNNASSLYARVLDQFLKESGQTFLPDDLRPYAAGISIRDICLSNSNRDKNRSPLAQISPCTAWWTEVRDYYKCAPKAVSSC